MIAQTPKPPYYSVIFTSVRTSGDNGYASMSNKMMQLASEQPGFLGVESAREEVGITVSYWQDEASIQQWREHIEHRLARKKGRELWYKEFSVRIAKVERQYSFDSSQDD
ncbi:MAG: antibiotic biosynthesis monooxygenase [Bacteroidales bacterium]|nr:antibiotic biosynthesis monooxygenase [Bacteroidales bacterium]